MIRPAGFDVLIPPSGAPRQHASRGSGWLARFEEMLESNPAAAGSPASAAATPAKAAAAARPVSIASTEATPAHAAAAGAAPPSFEPAWEEAVTGAAPDGTATGYNSKHFATLETAEYYARQLGGEVVEETLQGGFTRNAPERLIVVGKARLNAGLVADLYSRYPKELADKTIAATVARENAPQASTRTGKEELA